MKTLQWHEPARYRRLKYWQLERINPGRSLKLAGFTFCLMLILRMLAGASPAPNQNPPDWSQSTVLAIVVALVVAYGMPLMMGYVANSIVIISEKGVNNNSVWGGATIRFWSWSKIGLGYVWTDTMGGISYSVLSVCDHEGIVLVTVALSEKITIKELEGHFRMHGKDFRVEP